LGGLLGKFCFEKSIRVRIRNLKKRGAPVQKKAFARGTNNVARWGTGPLRTYHGT